MKKNFPTTKDYVYWLIALIVIIIILISFEFGSNENLIDYIGFAGTAASIILAIVAMIYAFQQSNESHRNNVETQNTLSSIRENVRGIKNIEIGVNDSNSQVKDVRNMIDELSKILKTDSKVGETEVQEVFHLYEKKVAELSSLTDFQVACISRVINFKKPSELNAQEIANEYMNFLNDKLEDVQAISFNVDASKDGYGISFNIGINSREITPDRLKKILEDYPQKDVRIFTVAKLIYAR